MNNPIDFNGFIQIALVVKDIRKAAETWSRFFNVPVPDIADHPPARNPELTYRGEPAYYGLKFAVIQAGSFFIELHEPDEHDSTFRSWKPLKCEPGNGAF